MPLIALVFLPTSLFADQFTVTEVYDGDTMKAKGSERFSIFSLFVLVFVGITFLLIREKPAPQV
jgi:hypothetical protein